MNNYLHFDDWSPFGLSDRFEMDTYTGWPPKKTEQSIF